MIIPKCLQRTIGVFAFSSVSVGTASAYSVFDYHRKRNFADINGNPKPFTDIMAHVSFSALFGGFMGPLIVVTSPITIPAILYSYATKETKPSKCD
jgi:hypothetical protein